MVSYCTPRILIVMFSAISLVAALPLIKLGRVGKVIVSVLILGACVGGYLSINLPYINDWMRTGTVVQYEAEMSEIRAQLLLENPDHEGIIMLALPSCPYCIEQFKTLKRLKLRNPNMDVSVFVACKDSAGLETFNHHVDDSEIPTFRIGNQQEVSELSNGRFPSFLYFREGKIVYRWSNGQFGYPALDWVENGLN